MLPGAVKEGYDWLSTSLMMTNREADIHLVYSVNPSTRNIFTAI
jgi:hypothetical protein